MEHIPLPSPPSPPALHLLCQPPCSCLYLQSRTIGAFLSQILRGAHRSPSSPPKLPTLHRIRSRSQTSRPSASRGPLSSLTPVTSRTVLPSALSSAALAPSTPSTHSPAVRSFRLFNFPPLSLVHPPVGTTPSCHTILFKLLSVQVLPRTGTIFPSVSSFHARADGRCFLSHPLL